MRTVTVHAPRACPVPDTGYALFYAYGDFQPSTAEPALQGRTLGEVGAPLDSLPRNTRQLFLDLSADQSRFTGYALTPNRGPIDVLAWPDGRSCALSGEIGKADRAGHQLTVTGPYALVSGGIQENSVPPSYVADLRTGRVERLPGELDLKSPRSRVSAVTFDGGVLVSGGARTDQSLVDSAERFVATDDRRGFDLSITLGTPRADHASVLLASGEVLLLGGVGPRALLDELEIVDVKQGRSRSAALARLAAPRRSPRALRLASGEILIAGGFDAAGAPVRTVEWLTRDATEAARPPRQIDVGAHQGLVALPAGGALIVTTLVAPRVGAGVVVVSPNGDIETAEEVAGNVTHIGLFASFGGAPVLWTGERWLRWQPWLGIFGPVATTVVGPRADDVFAAADPGLALWTEQGKLVGVRLDVQVRGPYSTEVRPHLRDDPGPLVPDRLVSATAVSAMKFDRETGLTLPQGGSVFLADATFASFELKLTMREGAAPLVVLRTDRGGAVEIGEALCPMPTGTKLTIVRRGARISVASDTGGKVSCSAPELQNERVAVGLRGRSEGFAFVRELEIIRVP